MSTITFSPVTGSAQLHIDTSYPVTARVAVIGEVDLATTPMLRERLLHLVHDQGPDLLDVDLAGVSFLDCTGLGMLIAVRNAALQAGGQMRVSHPQPIVRRVLEITGLLAVFTAATTVPAPQDPNTRPGWTHPSGRNQFPT